MAEAGDVKEGSIVQLKSGGPRMTVRSVENKYGITMVSCDWFVQDKPESGNFPLSSLNLLPE